MTGPWGTKDDFLTSFLHFSVLHCPLRLVIPGLSNPWWCLPTSFSVCLVFFSLSLCLIRWFWPDLMNGRHVHTTSVSLWWLEDLHVVRLAAGSWHRLPHWQHLCMRCIVSCGSTSFLWLVFLFAALLWGSTIHEHTERWMWHGSASVVYIGTERNAPVVPNWLELCHCCCHLCYPGEYPTNNLTKFQLNRIRTKTFSVNTV